MSEPTADQSKKAPQKTPWRRVKFAILVQLLNRRVRPWRWYVVTKACRPGTGGKQVLKHLQVVSPHGQHWDFKLSGGAWLRKAPSPDASPPSPPPTTS